MRAWIESMVIALGLCPFAQRVVRADRVRYVTIWPEEMATFVPALAAEMQALSAADAGFETTLILAPDFVDFEDYLDAVALAEALIEELALEGVLQVASFHPDYRFADGPDDDVAHFTNRAPVPAFHLLREADVARALADHPNPDGIAPANVAQLRALGLAAIMGRLDGI